MRAASILLSFATVFAPATRLGAAPMKARPADPSVRVESLKTTYRFENDGTGSISYEARLRVLTDAGRQGLVQVPVVYASAWQEARFEWLRCRKPDGTVVEADPAAALDLSMPVTQQAPAYSDLKAKVLPVPALAVGDSLEYRSVIRVVHPLEPGQFWALQFPLANAPVDEEITVLDLPEDRDVRLSFDGSQSHEVESKDGRTVHRWSRSAPDSPPTDGANDDEPVNPTFAVASWAGFDALGEWYLGLQKDRREVTPELRALAEKLVAGKTSAGEKLEAIYAHVAQSIRYLSLSFGIGGYRPHPPSEVERNAYGDCKDKDLLLRTLLSAVGIESRPALLSVRRGVLDEAVPTPSQFDHVITLATIEGRRIWLDATLGAAPVGAMAPGILGNKALVLDADGSRVVEVERNPGLDYRESVSVRGRLDALGSLSLDSRYEIRGDREVPLRQMALQGGPARRILGAFFAVRFGLPGDEHTEVVETSDPTSIATPFTIHLHTDAVGWAPLSGTKADVGVPGLTPDPLPQWDREAIEKRAAKGPLRLRGPWTFEDTVEIEIDPAWEIVLPAAVRVERSFGTYETAYRFADGTLTAHRIVQMQDPTLAPDRKDELHSLVAIARKDADQKLVVRRREGAGVADAAEAMDADALNTAGMAAIDAGNFDLAVELLERATSLAPEHEFAWNNLGRARLGQFKTAEAEKAFRRQIEVHPQDEYAYANLGRILLRRGATDEAIAQFRKQLEIDPLDEETHVDLGAALGTDGRWDEAVGEFRRAVEISPERGATRAAFGMALLRQGSEADARKELEASMGLEMEPGTRISVATDLEKIGVLYDVADRLARIGMDESAANLGDITLSHVPDRYSSALIALRYGHRICGMVALRQSRYEQAVEHLSLAYDMWATSDVGFRLAEALSKLGRSEQALRYFALAMRRAEQPETMPSSLETWAKKKYGGKAGVDAKVLELGKEDLEVRRLVPEGGDFRFPKADPGKNGVEFDVRALVDESGSVVDSSVLGGKAPWTTAALADLKRVRFKPLVASGRAIRSIRSIHFFYLPGSLVRAFWSFAPDEKTIDALNALHAGRTVEFSLP